MTDLERLPFRYWMVDCVIYGAETRKSPLDYKWRLFDCPEWTDRYNAGMTPEEAVNSEFSKH